MHLWQATWEPDSDSESPERRHVRFTADYDRLADADLISKAYGATRRQRVIDGYALTRYWKLTELTGTYEAIGETLGELEYPELTDWLEQHPEVLAVRPRTPVVDVLLESMEDGRRLERKLRERLAADVSVTLERATTRKPGTTGTVGQVPRLPLRTQFPLEEAVERHLAD